jgi:hypothetical protein
VVNAHAVLRGAAKVLHTSAARCLAVLTAACALLGAPPASADGRIYASDYTPEIADQRALIAFDGKRQVMLIENQLSLGKPAKQLGWVVPVPSEPQFAAVDKLSVARMYRQLRHKSDPRTLPVAPLVLLLVPFAYVFGIFLGRRKHPDATLLRASALLGLIGGLLSLVSLSTTMPAPAGIEVVKALEVGPLEVKVLRASSATELADWLKSNGFASGSQDAAVVEGYVQRGWLFVTAKLSPRAGSAFQGDSVTPPLLMSFATREALYPVALTAAGGQPLELALYVFAAQRVEPTAAMRVAYAGTARLPNVFFAEDDKAAAALFAGLDPSPHYLTKLTQRLDASRMREDMRFASAAERGDFRGWTVGPVFAVWVGGALVIAAIAFLLQLAGRGRWRVSALAWFAISICVSWLLAALLLVVNLFRQYWQRNPEGSLSTGPRPPSAP